MVKITVSAGRDEADFGRLVGGAQVNAQPWPNVKVCVLLTLTDGMRLKTSYDRLNNRL
jgi:hypothetical protein